MKWTDAEKYCVDQGGHLASVTSSAINEFVFQGMVSKGFRGKPIAIWVGGYDFDDETNWKWTDCSPFQHLFWGEGEPNNLNIEGCMHQVLDWDGHGGVSHLNRKWNDYSCNAMHYSLCKKRICGRGTSNTLANPIPTQRPNNGFLGGLLNIFG